MAESTRTPKARLAFGALGLVFIAGAVWVTYQAFRPYPGPGHIDGRGLFLVFIVPPVAGTGGVILGWAVIGGLPPWRRYLTSLIVYPAFAVLAVVPSVWYILNYSARTVSKELYTYNGWFLIALLPAFIVVGYTSLARIWATYATDQAA